MDLLAVGVLGMAVLVAATTIPRWALLALINVLLTLGNVVDVMAIPVGALVALVTFLMLGSDERRAVPALAARISWCAALLSALSLVISLWSPDPNTAYRSASLWAALSALIPFAVAAFWKSGTDLFGRVLLVLAPVAAIQTFTVVVFRLFPDREAAYYSSNLAVYFVGKGGYLLNTSTGFNNVLDLKRAGGFLFLNCNIASMFMGVLAMLYLAYAAQVRRAWPVGMALVLAVGVAFAGSKTGWALGIVLPVMALLMYSLARGRDASARIMTLVVGLMLAGVGIQFLTWFGDAYISASQTTLLPRLQIWSQAVKAIDSSLLQGLGFGGWIERWQLGGVTVDLTPRPAHNWALQAALDGGVFYLVATVAFMFLSLYLVVSSITEEAPPETQLSRAFAGMALLWIFIHGMGDTSWVYGTSMTVGLIPLAIAFLALRPEPQVASRTPAGGSASAVRTPRLT